jgi:hypothetical protein
MGYPETAVPPGLANLGDVVLPSEQEAELRRLCEASLGPPMWRARKQAEARDLLALAQITPRMTLLALTAITDLRAVVRLRTPVPCLPPGADDLCVEDEVDLGIAYPEEILRVPLPGYALVEILAPRHIHHPNVGARGSSQRMCLGAQVPRGYPLREAMCATYAALTLQSVMLDERDPAGVMNFDAAKWWQLNAQRIPLSAAPFLASVREARSRS